MAPFVSVDSKRQQSSIRWEQRDKNRTNHFQRIWISGKTSSLWNSARSCSLFVNLKDRGERKEVKRGERGKKKCGLMPTGKIVVTLMMCRDAPNRERYPRFPLCEFQTRLPGPSWPHRWTFEKQSLESVPSNGFIKEVIILQRGGAVNGRSNDVFHHPTLTKLFIQGRTEYLQLSVFQRGKELFSPLSSPTFTEHWRSLGFN